MQMGFFFRDAPTDRLPIELLADIQWSAGGLTGQSEGPMGNVELDGSIYYLVLSWCTLSFSFCCKRCRFAMLIVSGVLGETSVWCFKKLFQFFYSRQGCFHAKSRAATKVCRIVLRGSRVINTTDVEMCCLVCSHSCISLKDEVSSHRDWIENTATLAFPLAWPRLVWVQRW